LFDILAERDTSGFWRPGLTPTSIPTDEESLRESRKRVSDPKLRNLDKKPNWFWFGLSVGYGNVAPVFGDAALSSLLWQVQSAVRLLRSRRHASTLARAAGILSSGALEIGSEKYSQLKTGFSVAKELLELFSTEFVAFSEIDDDLLGEVQIGLRKALDELTAFSCASIAVLDDAHLAHPHILRGLAGALVEGAPVKDQGRSYFDIAAPAADRRLLVLATTWSRPHGEEFWRWFEEAQTTGVRCLTYREEEGWFGGLSSDLAAALLRDNLAASVSTTTVDRIVGKGAIEGRIAPILLMRYVIDTIEREFHDDDGVDAFIASLPVTVEDIAAQRYAALTKTEQDAVVLAGALGYAFPVRSLRFSLTARLKSNADDTENVIDSLVKARYLVVDQSEAFATIQSCRFADELDFGFVRNRCSRYRWVNGAIHKGIDEWFVELVAYLSADLESGSLWIPFVDIIASARGVALEWLARGFDTSGSVSILCKALVSPEGSSDESDHDVPRNFAELAAWHFRRMADRDRAIPLAILQLTARIASRSRVTANIALWTELRRSLLSQEQDAIAQSLLRITVSFMPSLLRLAEIYIEDDRREDAKNVLAAAGSKSAAAIRLAGLYVEDERREDAKTLLAAVAGDVDAAMKLAGLYLEDEQREDAKNVLAAVAYDVDAAMKLAGLYVEDGKLDGAKARLATVSHRYEAAMKLAGLYLKDGQREAAKSLLAGAAHRSDAAVSLAKLYVEDGQRNEARTLLRRFANEGQVARKLAAMCLEDGQRDEAKAVLAGAASESHAAITLAKLYVEDGQRDEAKAVLAGAASESHAAITLAKLYVEDGQRDEAKAVLRGVSNEGQAARNLAVLYLEDGERGEAKAILVGAAHESQAAIALAKLHAEDGDRTEAKTVLKRMAHVSQAAITLAGLLVEDEDRKEAKRVLSRVRREGSAAIRLASLLADDGAFEEAISVLRPQAKKHAVAALMMAQYAMNQDVLAAAQTFIHAHLRRGPRFVFAKMTEYSCSAADLLRAIPPTSTFLPIYRQYLYEDGKNASRAAGLGALLTASCFPSMNEAAVQLVRPFLATDVFCACAMTLLRLSADDSCDLLSTLQEHARAGRQEAIYALARLAIEMNDQASQRVALALMQQQPEFTDAEKKLLAILAGPKVAFRKLRDQPDPRGTIQIWQLEAPPK
jgi:thioredoxin-like negative regulator of GroEL